MKIISICLAAKFIIFYRLLFLIFSLNKHTTMVGITSIIIIKIILSIFVFFFNTNNIFVVYKYTACYLKAST